MRHRRPQHQHRPEEADQQQADQRRAQGGEHDAVAGGQPPRRPLIGDGRHGHRAQAGQHGEPRARRRGEAQLALVEDDPAHAEEELGQPVEHGPHRAARPCAGWDSIRIRRPGWRPADGDSRGPSRTAADPPRAAILPSVGPGGHHHANARALSRRPRHCRRAGVLARRRPAARPGAGRPGAPQRDDHHGEPVGCHRPGRGRHRRTHHRRRDDRRHQGADGGDHAGDRPGRPRGHPGAHRHPYPLHRGRPAVQHRPERPRHQDDGRRGGAGGGAGGQDQAGPVGDRRRLGRGQAGRTPAHHRRRPRQGVAEQSGVARQHHRPLRRRQQLRDEDR